MASHRSEGGKYVNGSATALPKYSAMKATSTAGEIDVATAISDIPFGISAEAAESGDNVGVFLPGQTVKAVAGAAIAKNAYVTAAAAGQFVTCTKNATPTTTPEFAWGYALTAATAQNDLFELYFFPMLSDWT
jgi:hypothetical protein